MNGAEHQIKEEVCIVRAKLKKDYVYDALQEYGFQITTPYKGNPLLFRLMREVFFRCKLPLRNIWYKNVPSNCKTIVMFDPLILPEYITWIHRKNPQVRIILSYENRANNTIHPDAVPSYVEKWSYDKDDCRDFSMRWSAPAYFMTYKRDPNAKPKYDVLYVGRDKGRAEYLLELEKELQEKGLTTYFHICADRQFMGYKKRYYKKLLSYDAYLELLIDTKAVLNIVPEGQKSVTQREMEAAFDGIKCITNNRGVKDFELFDKSIFFILGEDDFNSVDSFLRQEVRRYSRTELEQFDFYNRINSMIEAGRMDLDGGINE